MQPIPKVRGASSYHVVAAVVARSVGDQSGALLSGIGHSRSSATGLGRAARHGRQFASWPAAAVRWYEQFSLRGSCGTRSEVGAPVSTKQNSAWSRLPSLDRQTGSCPTFGYPLRGLLTRRMPAGTLWGSAAPVGLVASGDLGDRLLLRASDGRTLVIVVLKPRSRRLGRPPRGASQAT